MIEKQYCSESVPEDVGNVGTPTSAPTVGGDLTSGANEHGASLLSFILAASTAPFFAVTFGL
jgi:hypothetical protein